MENIKNFRDLGGIRSNNGRLIKKGFFYRSATLNYASSKDIEKIISLSIKNIVDFRDQSEHGDQDIYTRMEVEYYSVPIALDSAKICNLQRNRTLKTALIPLDGEDMRIAYRNMPFNNDSYKLLIKLIREGNVPLLFHCTVGKDRTGVAAAIILLLLGVSRDNIIKDYLVTKSIEPFIIKYITKNISPLVRKRITRCMMPVFLARTSYINSAIDEIIRRYGSYENYFNLEYGIDHSELERIRSIYTE